MIDWRQFPSARELYENVLDYRGWHLHWDVLLPWAEKGRPLMDVLAPFRDLAGPTMNPDIKAESLWQFYALSRVSDQLLLPSQSRPNEMIRPAISREEYVQFFETLGFSAIAADTAIPFSPFHHEVFEVDRSERNEESVIVLNSVWPGLRFGEMLFSRCGVIVAGGARNIRKEVAESSTLYFTFRRLRRATEDLSHGWGSNSQWRTSIRRDYECNGRLYYNVDGSNALATGADSAADKDELTADERLELCRNRCFIRTARPHVDLWPYDDRYEEDRPTDQEST